jgi:sugar O-acyltransferase (sialic acid O-acetyltransferase NeuD family)
MEELESTEGKIKPVIIFGAGSLGKAALNIFEQNDVVVYGFLDDDESLHGTEIGEVAVLGNTKDHGFLKYIGKKCDAFVAYDEVAVRKNVVDMLKEKRKVMPVNAFHQHIKSPKEMVIGHGNLLNAGVVIGAHTTIGNHCLVHSGAIIEHEVSLGDFVQVGAGSIINSGVEVDEEVFIGSGVTVVSGIHIGKGARIGAGSVVIADVKEGETVFGNPAKPV